MAQSVRYTGTSDERILTVTDFARIGVAGDDVREIKWSRDNDFVVPREKMSFLDEETFERIIKLDSNLTVVDDEDEDEEEEDVK